MLRALFGVSATLCRRRQQARLLAIAIEIEIEIAARRFAARRLPAARASRLRRVPLWQ
jgi:hypothetical protein